ncbi:FtsX-like permease family protein [Frigidibacter sp. SD6-1]|uniref:cell division protein FtsX n=1 Tax=Frigidibacter sp. SD6-1 TaxID=3032581 RepID=UPI0024DFAE25|nr:FtsX-like permease family protein [Frigidibacter sp. SD6-1]
MIARLSILAPLFGGRSGADRVVPSTGPTALLTMLTAAAMAFLAIFALALAMATGRLADRWAGSLERSATIRISAPADQIDRQTAKVLEVLEQTPGVEFARATTPDETRKLLEPWLGPDLPVEDLPLPQLVEVTQSEAGFDAEGLHLRLAAEAPGAVLDDHERWRAPLVASAERIRAIGLLSLALITGATAAMITLAAQAALAANGQVIRALRLIGAEDRYIARAFVRRFTLRTLAGALAGTFAGALAIALMPAAEEEAGFLTGLGFQGLQWLWPLAIPALAAILAFVATRMAAFRVLRTVR